MEKVYDPTKAPNYFEFGRFLEQQKTDEERLKDLEKEKKELTEIRTQLKEIYVKIIDVLKDYCDLDENHYKLVSLWILGTYFHDSFPTYPFLFFNAPKASGKTRLLRLISHLSHNGNLLNSLNESVMFRTAKGSTLCFDEAERLNAKGKEALKELLHVAYKRGSIIKRMRKTSIKDNENYVVDSFEAYCAIAMANIWGMDDVLGDRCLNIILSKSNNPIYTSKMELYEFDEKITNLKALLYKLDYTILNQSTQEGSKDTLIFKDDKVYLVYHRVAKYINRTYIGWNNYLNQNLTNKRETEEIQLHTHIHTYTTLHYSTLDKSDKDNNTLHTYTTLHNTTLHTPFYNKVLENNLTGRDLELFFPLFFLSWSVGEEVFEEFLGISKEITANKIDNELVTSRDTALVDFVSRLDVGITDYIKVFTIAYKEFLEEDMDKNSSITNDWVGRALKRNGLILSKKRMNKGMLVTLDIPKAKKKAWILGLTPNTEEAQTPTKPTEEAVK